MTCGDIIARCDELEPNQYGTTLKLYWLSILDGQVIDELLKTHVFPPFAPRPPIQWKDPLDRWGWDRPPREPAFPPQSGLPGSKEWENRPIWGPPGPPPFPPPKPSEEEEEGEAGEGSESSEDACQCEDCPNMGEGTGNTCRCGGRHNKDEDEEEEEKKEPPKPPYTSAADELIILDPYGSQIYLHWLQAQIASENSEIAKYNQQMALYNTAYQTFCNYINRTYMPKRPHGGNRFHF